MSLLILKFLAAAALTARLHACLLADEKNFQQGGHPARSESTLGKRRQPCGSSTSTRSHDHPAALACLHHTHTHRLLGSVSVARWAARLLLKPRLLPSHHPPRPLPVHRARGARDARAPAAGRRRPPTTPAAIDTAARRRRRRRRAPGGAGSQGRHGACAVSAAAAAAPRPLLQPLGAWRRRTRADLRSRVRSSGGGGGGRRGGR
jgi:hypothetical protein